MSASNRTENRWRLRVLDRSTFKPIATLTSGFSGRGSFALDDHSQADLEIDDFTCAANLVNVRQQAHWVELKCIQDPAATLLGPIVTPPVWDRETGKMRLIVNDWLVEPLRQQLHRRTVYTASYIEVAMKLLELADAQLPAAAGIAVHRWVTTGTFPLEVLPPKPVSQYWQTLTTAGMRWAVAGNKLTLGINTDRVVELDDTNWNDENVQVSHEPLANLVVFKGADDLVVWYPSPDHRSAGPYPTVPVEIIDPNVTSPILALQIAQATHERRSNPAPLVSGSNQSNLSWADAMPGTAIDYRPSLWGKVRGRPRTNYVSSGATFEITNGIETLRTVELTPRLDELV